MLFTRAAELFATARSKAAGKPLENNTRLEKLDNGDYGVRLHNTIVVTIHADGTYTLRTGGWHTVTTKDRINGYSPARVFQEKGEWFVAAPDFTRRVPFVEGIRVDANGEPVKGKAVA
jgi:hypothetical protein